MVQIDSEIIGALLGAIVGAFFGALVSRLSIRYDRKIAACSAMQALADEARFNAHVVRHLGEEPWDTLPSALERQAFDAALPVLYILPRPLRDRSRDARAKILIMMHLDEVLEKSPAMPDAGRTAMMDQRHDLMSSLPEELERIADDVEAFVKTDCTARWLGSRTSSG